jgi:hypothetical protein
MFKARDFSCATLAANGYAIIAHMCEKLAKPMEIKGFFGNILT